MSVSHQVGLPLANFLMEVIGTSGPISFQTQIACVHRFPEGDYDLQRDLFILGKDGEEITVDQIREFLNSIQKYINELQFDPFYTYHRFKKLAKTGDREYTIQWESLK